MSVGKRACSVALRARGEVRLLPRGEREKPIGSREPGEPMAGEKRLSGLGGKKRIAESPQTFLCLGRFSLVSLESLNAFIIIFLHLLLMLCGNISEEFITDIKHLLVFGGKGSRWVASEG